MTFTPGHNPAPKPERKFKEPKPKKKRSRLQPRARTAEEFARIYGSEERAEWVKLQPCIACGGGPCDNAHIENEGKSRKASYLKIVPLCSTFPWSENVGCHDELDEMKRETFEALYGIDLAKEAVKLEQRWQSHKANNP